MLVVPISRWSNLRWVLSKVLRFSDSEFGSVQRINESKPESESESSYERALRKA